jgi:hypothetical protein
MFNLLNHILKANSGSLYYTFSNADGKTWLMPKKNMRTAMNLYQPAGMNGKLMKQIFPYLWWIKPLRTKLRITVNQYALQKNLNELLRSVFHTQHLEFSIFCGTPSIHQKTTMQISCGNRILGYCKITNDDEIIKMFVQEQSTLEFLRNKGVEHIPKCLYCGNLNNGISIFVQSTEKSNQSKIVHQWTNRHTLFLNELYKNTRQNIDFINTDFYKSLAYLQTVIQNFRPEDVPVIQKAIDIVLSYYEGYVDFSVYHADFTPWNIFFEMGNIFVFDWEYTQKTYPPFLDWFHYIFQVAIIENKLNTKYTYNFFCKHKSKYVGNDNIEIMCLCYLLNILSFYFQIHNGKFDTQDIGYQRWTGLIRMIFKNTCQI